MIKIEMTPNITGVAIYGDVYDMSELHDSLIRIVGSESEFPSLEGPRLRVLGGLCYELRHAMMGNREITFVDNGIDQEMMKRFSIITNTKNTYFVALVFWPELLFITSALNDFVWQYARKISKQSYDTLTDWSSVWDPSIVHVRSFQAAVAKCLKEVVQGPSYSRLIKLLNPKYGSGFSGYTIQYIDVLNSKFIKMDNEKRLKNITIMAKRIMEKGKEYEDVKEAVIEAAMEYKCSRTEIRLELDFPEKIEW